MKDQKNKMVFAIIALVVVVLLIGCVVYGYYKKATFQLQNPVVTMEIEGYGTVKMELYPEKAPDTVKNFIKLINDGYYDGLTFHRVVKDKLIQGGDKAGDGSGGSEKSVKGEFLANDYKDNDLKFEEGTIGLARQDFTSYGEQLGVSELTKQGYNTGYSQFFIMASAESGFNGLYTAFGKVTEGLDIIKKISKLETTKEKNEKTGKKESTEEPKKKPIIKSMSVETFGIKYGEPNLVDTFDMNAFLMQYLSY